MNDRTSAPEPGAVALETGPTPLPRRIGPSDLHVFPLALSGTVFGWTADGPTTTGILDRFAEFGVRYFGGSDHTGNRLIEARIAAAQSGVAHMVALQQHYNLVHRAEYEAQLARVAAQLDLGVMPRFALASGFLSGKYRSRADLERHRRGGEVAAMLTRRNLRILHALDRIASETQSAVATVSLAWLLSRPHVVGPVVSVSAPDQLDVAMAAPHLVLSRQQLTELDRVSE